MSGHGGHGGHAAAGHAPSEHGGNGHGGNGHGGNGRGAQRVNAAVAERRRVSGPLDEFLAFVGEMDRQRTLVERRRAAPMHAENDALGPPPDFPTFLLDAPLPVIEQEQAAAQQLATAPSLDPEVVLERLQSYLEATSRNNTALMSDVMLAQYREIQYTMVALADDTFIQEVDWDGRDAWRLNHLENRLFRSRLAGDRIFDRMDALLASGDRRLVPLASVYLCMLSLGFKGRYRVPGGDQAIRAYAERLFQMITGREPALLQTWGGEAVPPIMPATYAHTVRGNPSGRLRKRARWGMILLGIVIAWLLIGQALWWVSAAGVGEQAKAVLRAAGDQR